MRSSPLSLAAPAAFLVAILASCVGDDAQLDPTVDGADGGSNLQCVGNTVDACGATCAVCTSPKGGHAECESGACKAVCDATPTSKLCGADCADTAVDGDNCGACGKSCDGGACVSGKCQAAALVEGLTKTHAFAFDANGLYVAADTDVVACPLPAGCGLDTPRKVAAGYPQLSDLLLEGSKIVFTAGTPDPSDYYFAWTCPTSGCAVESDSGAAIGESTNRPFDRIFRGTDHFLLTSTSSVYDGTANAYIQRGILQTCDAAGCAQDKLVTVRSSHTPTDTDEIDGYASVTANATTVYYATKRQKFANSWMVRSCPVGAACTPTTDIVSTNDAVTQLRIDDTNVLWGSTDGSGSTSAKSEIWSIAPTKKTIARDEQGIRDFALDATHVYWVNDKTGTVQRCARSGCMPAPETLVSGQAAPSRIALDANHVYWMTPTGIYRLPKP